MASAARRTEIEALVGGSAAALADKEVRWRRTAAVPLILVVLGFLAAGFKVRGPWVDPVVDLAFLLLAACSVRLWLVARQGSRAASSYISDKFGQPVRASWGGSDLSRWQANISKATSGRAWMVDPGAGERDRTAHEVELLKVTKTEVRLRRRTLYSGEIAGLLCVSNLAFAATPAARLTPPEGVIVVVWAVVWIGTGTWAALQFRRWRPVRAEKRRLERGISGSRH